MGQSINYGAILATFRGILQPKLYIPTCSVSDIRYIDFAALRAAGYMAVCFDKDNTLTLPYQKKLFEPFKEALEECQSYFGHQVAVLSNSAGSNDDTDNVQAKELEGSLGLPVIRHRWKKPLCGKDILKHFKMAAVRIVLIGDRLSTDVWMANNYGMLSIHTRPLSIEGDNENAIKIRSIENFLLDKLGQQPYSRADLQSRFTKSE